MNDTLKVLETRRSCRNFKPDMVSEDDLKAIVRAGTYAATGMGKQSPLIIAVTDKTMRDEISEANRKIGGWDEGFDPFYGAPVILIVLAKKDSIWIHRAKEEFESDFGKNILAKLGISDEYEGIGHCALGYAAEPVKEPAPRKDNYVYYI